MNCGCGFELIIYFLYGYCDIKKYISDLFYKKKIVLTNSIIKGHEIKKFKIKRAPYVSTKYMSFQVCYPSFMCASFFKKKLFDFCLLC